MKETSKSLSPQTHPQLGSILDSLFSLFCVGFECVGVV